MSLHPYAEYWDKGEANVPDMTGAKHLLDCRDLKAIFEAFGIAIPVHKIADIGCGTGRMSQLCDLYGGFDISPSMIEYCRNRGLSAHLITGTRFTIKGPVSLVTCISVFTHIDRPERQAYLQTFGDWEGAKRLLVDIIPGDGTGAVELWTAKHDDMVDDLIAAGFKNHRWVDQAWDMHTHRYFFAEKP